METQLATVSFGQRLAELAREAPQRPAVVLVPTSGHDVVLTRGDLDRWSNRIAHLLAEHDVTRGSTVALALGNCLEEVAAAFAVWKLGGCVLPMSPGVPASERDAMLGLGEVGLTLSEWLDTSIPNLGRADLAAADRYPDTTLPDVVSAPGKAIGTGGSTGRPKIIVDRSPWVHFDIDPAGTLFGQLGFRMGQRQLVAGPLYHGFGFDWTFRGLMWEHVVVLLERFDAERAVAAIERHRIEYAGFVPTMMRRILHLPGIRDRDLSSLEAIMHTAAPCPPAVKRGWIDLIGAEKVYEGYGGAEGFGNTVIRGDEWLAHEGSIGRPVAGVEVRVLDEDGREPPRGEVGGIYVRRAGGEVRNPYVGAPAPTYTPDGFTTFGDLGWVDEDGYVYLADRRTDMIVTGGVNVYPAEVEAALLEHPAIADAVVVGLPDEEWGRRVHAVYAVVEGAPPPSDDELRDHARARLAGPKVPKTWERVERVPRDAAGKIRRSALADARTGGD
ncbi:MAG TPA: AMP-binding protein [Nitriliruptorales bacterium]